MPKSSIAIRSPIAPQRGQLVQYALFHFHRQRLADLQLQHGRWRLVGSDGVTQAQEEIGLAQFAGGNIDGDALRNADCGPARGGFAHFVHHPVAQRDDDAAFLRDRHERSGHDQVALGMCPAHQRFGGHRAALADVDLRLKLQQKFVALQRQHQLALQVGAIRRLQRQLGGVHFRPTASVMLGMIHGNVGGAQ